MKVYKNKFNGFAEIRRKIVLRTIPLMVLVLAFVIGTGYNDGDLSTLPYLLVLLLVALGFGIYRGIVRQRRLFESYTLTIDEDSIQREQLNTATVRIRRGEVAEILKSEVGGFVIRGRNRADFIIVPNQIENAAELELDLCQFGDVRVPIRKSVLEIMRIPIILSLLILMAIVYISSNKWLVLGSGTILTVALIWSLYEIQVSKNIDKKTKRNSWWTVVVIMTVISVMYSKFAG